MIHQVNLDILDILLTNGANVSALDHNGNNVLHLAVVGSDMPMLKHLLGFNRTWSDQINEHNSDGLTPLIHTVITNQLPLARCLLESDADPNVPDKKSGRTALFYAIEENNRNQIRHSLLTLLKCPFSSFDSQAAAQEFGRHACPELLRIQFVRSAGRTRQCGRRAEPSSAGAVE